ncbi:5'-3' exonuclease [Agreia sp. VKM Ac-1783]|uniref:5'-3' exonuclease n=1 Tax=Agreia sp. VKM Ac-1783 TaxID=1938889 RepID=UPI000A2AB079|nr:5'-3' exonuclease [Agreia sp. VKM Ac-1783]SMQ68473.1 5'-3' exonuclease [Agreia sp. VKM Ac-1783]
MADRLMLLDTASLYFRAFYGVPDSIKRDDGTPVNAIRGLLDMIARLTTEFEATHLIACWDDNWRPSWRVDLLPSYKAQRVAETAVNGLDVEEVPTGLTAQIPLIREVLDLAGIAIVGAADHEADDVIGTYASRADHAVDIVTGDRDQFQLVDDAHDVRVIYTARGMKNLELVTDEVIVSKYRVLPSQYVDYATLRGDTSDGLPGVSGVGDKTAATLLAEYGSLVSVRDAAKDADSGLSGSVRSKLTAASDYLDVAPKVVRVVRDLELPTPSEAGARLTPVTGTKRDELESLSKDWNLGGSVTRLLAALDTYA